MTDIKLIGLAGQKQVGKSTAAGLLEAQGFYRIAFADPLKQMVAVLLKRLGFSHSDIAFLEGEKEKTIPVLKVTYRHLLQTLGTEWGRKQINANIWMQAAGFKIDQLGNETSVVVEDVRFDNEAAFIRGRGGKIVHLKRDTGLRDGHESENAMVIDPDDLVINNDGSIEQFKKTLLSVVGIAMPHSDKSIEVGEFRVDYFDWDGMPIKGQSVIERTLNQAMSLIEEKAPRQAHSCQVMRCVYDAVLANEK